MTIGRIPSVEGGIQPTIVDAKGDLIAGVAADSVNRLAVGTNGTVLTADSSTSTGLAWTGVNQMDNPFINGGMDVWQRGTSFSIAAGTSYTSGYTADRWQTDTVNKAAITVSRQTTGDTTNLPNIQYCLRFQRNSGQTSTTTQYIAQSLETVNSIPFAGKTVTLSFYARAGANYSATSNALTALLVTGTGTDQNAWGVYTGAVNAINQTATLTTTWQRFTFTATLNATITEIYLAFGFAPTGTASTNDWFEITGVQLDIGTYTASTAPTFRRAGGTLQGELAACRRYLPMVSATNSEVATGYSYGTNLAIYQFYFDVPARVAPTGITLSGNFYGYALNTTYAITPVFNGSSQYGATLVSGSGLTITAGQGSRLATNGTSTILFTGCEL